MSRTAEHVVGGRLVGWPPDVVTNGCLSCGGPALFVHAGRSARSRVCDCCSTEWNVDDVGGAIVAGLCRVGWSIP